MAIATTTAIVAGLIGIGGAVAAKSIMGSGPKMDSSPAALPQPPSPDGAQAKAEAGAARRKASLTETVFTSPLGIGGEAQLARKTLTGQ